MKTKLSAISGILVLSAILMLAAPAMLSAQDYNNTPVAVSKEKVKVGGKVCYSHIVLEKQTLYSISKAYNVSIEDIYQYNPGLKETGLKKNSIILIPLSEAPKEEGRKEEVVKVEQQAAPVEIKKPVTFQKKKGQKTHIKKWYEDIEMIASHYGVKVEDIMFANGLKDKKLANRQKLIIPESMTRHNTDEAVTEQEVTETPADILADVATAQEEPDSSSSADQQELSPILHKEKIEATVLLPLRNAEGKLSRNNMDFYSGIMLAVYDLGEKGISTDLHVYDIADRSTPVAAEDIYGSDIIIGPITAADLTTHFQQSAEGKAVISPLDPRAEHLVAEYNNLIHIPTPHRLQYQDLTNWIKEEMGENDKVFMFSERTARTNDAVRTMKEVMDSSGISYIPFTYSILEGRDVLEPLKEMMTAEGANRIYIASESEAFVNDVVRNLNLMLLENFEVVLYAPSKIRSFETIEVEHFHKTAMRVSLTYYINYDDPAVRNFLLKYRALYNTEPSQFAFQGYDIANYFISMVSKYGDNWMEHLQESEKAMLQSSFRCMKQGTGGYVNTGVRRIVYGPNWTITQVK